MYSKAIKIKINLIKNQFYFKVTDLLNFYQFTYIWLNSTMCVVSSLRK